MTKWIIGRSYKHKLSGVQVRMIGWTTDGRPVIERCEQEFGQYTCYDIAKCAVDFYDIIELRWLSDRYRIHKCSICGQLKNLHVRPCNGVCK